LFFGGFSCSFDFPWFDFKLGVDFLQYALQLHGDHVCKVWKLSLLIWSSSRRFFGCRLCLFLALGLSSYFLRCSSQALVPSPVKPVCARADLSLLPPSVCFFARQCPVARLWLVVFSTCAFKHQSVLIQEPVHSQHQEQEQSSSC
jgi:hypothetical protein